MPTEFGSPFILFTFSLGRWCIRILHLEPVPRAAGLVLCSLAFRDDPLAAEIAGVGEDAGAVVTINVLIELDAGVSPAQEFSERRLPGLDPIGLKSNN